MSPEVSAIKRLYVFTFSSSQKTKYPRNIKINLYSSFILQDYDGPNKGVSMKSHNFDLQHLAQLISQTKFTMLTTVNEDGSMQSRPMANQKIHLDKFNGVLWFFTKKDSFKIKDLNLSEDVNLAYSNPDKQQYVSISGKASLTTEKKLIKEFWTPALKTWFPKGVNDPEIALIRVETKNAEIWEGVPNKLVQAVCMMRAILTGKSYSHNAHHKHIHLQT